MTETKLEESLAKFSGLYDFAPVGYVTSDEHGTIKEANLTAARQLGTPRGQLIKSPFTNFKVVEYADEFHLDWRKVFKNEKRETCDVRMIPKSGGYLCTLLDSILVQKHRAMNCAERRLWKSPIASGRDVLDRKQGDWQRRGLGDEEMLRRERSGAE